MHKIPPFPFELPSVQTVPDFDSLVESLDHYEPRVAHGLAKDWRLSKKLEGLQQHLSIDAAAELFDEKQIRYTQLAPEMNGGMGIGDDLKPNFKIDDASLPAREFLSLARDLTNDQSGASVYAAAMLLEDFPKFAELMPKAETMNTHQLWKQLLWVGSGGHVVDLHYDQRLNFIAMFSGTKRITLFPPSALPLMYPAPLHRTVGGVPRSMVKLLSPDFERYPNFQNALEQAQQVVLHPGDVLFIPPMWWHCVESFGFNLMINSWYDDTTVHQSKILTSAKLTLHSAMVATSKTELQSAEITEALNILSASNTSLKTPKDSQLSEVLVSQPKLKTCLLQAQQELGSMSQYWRDWFILQYKYYVLRTYGDPYPTLPGAFEDFVKHERKSQWKRNPILVTTMRGARWIRNKARQLINR